MKYLLLALLSGCSSIGPAVLPARAALESVGAAFGTTTVTLTEAWAAPDQAAVEALLDRVDAAGYTMVLDYARGRITSACAADVDVYGSWSLVRPACMASVTGEHARAAAPPFTWWRDAMDARGLTKVVRVDFPFFGPDMPWPQTQAWETKRTIYAYLFADWAATVAQSTGAQVIQIGNEPDRWGNQTSFFSGAQYVDLLRVVTPTVRAVSAAEIWGGVTSDLGDFWPNTFAGSDCPVSPDRGTGMAQGMLDAGIASWIDRFAVHDYHVNPTGPQAGCADWDLFPSGASQWAAVDAKLAAAGLPPFVITEQGVALAKLPGTTAQRLQAQADFETTTMQRANAAGRIRIGYTFELQSASDTGSDPETNYSLVRTVVPWNPRPAYSAVQNYLEAR